MVATDSVFAGSIPEIYDRLLVPILFEPYARDLSERLARLGPKSVLETAAGTGALTRAMASRLPAGTRIVATDLNQPMLDHAAVSIPNDGRIDWHKADALSLPFEDGAFDAVICQFGVMFFPDKVEGFTEARRVLKPGGTFIFNVWDRISENAFATVVFEAMSEMFPTDPPSFMARTPHGYHDLDLIRADLTAAGFGTIKLEACEQTSVAATPRDAAIAFCQGTPLRAEIEARDATRLEEATRIAANAFVRRFGSGPMKGHLKAYVVSAVR
jgi:ubiquinone/menaquinone biosynthesis C-methylase UbiE